MEGINNKNQSLTLIYLKEFYEALKSSYSYRPIANLYFFSGFFWGIPVPLFIFGTLLWLQNKPLNFEQSLLLLNEHPWLWFFPFHPIFFGVLFGTFGTIRQQKQFEISSLIETLKQEAKTDDLTGLFNRRHFMEIFEKEYIRAQRGNNAFSIVLFDLDNFKRINDKFGHLTGDEILKEISKIFKNHSRPYDTVARWGGEEFLILFPDTNQNEAHEIADRIRENFESHTFIDNGQSFNCTLSAGVTQYKEVINDPTQLFDQADQALYIAKQLGKNKIETYKEYERVK